MDFLTGIYAVNLTLHVTAMNPLDAVDQFSLAIINNGLDGYAFRVVNPNGVTNFVVGSDIMTPNEFEEAFRPAVDTPTPTFDPAPDEEAFDPETPAPMPRPLPEPVHESSTNDPMATPTVTPPASAIIDHQAPSPKTESVEFTSNTD